MSTGATIIFRTRRTINCPPTRAGRTRKTALASQRLHLQLNPDSLVGSAGLDSASIVGQNDDDDHHRGGCCARECKQRCLPLAELSSTCAKINGPDVGTEMPAFGYSRHSLASLMRCACQLAGMTHKKKKKKKRRKCHWWLPGAAKSPQVTYSLGPHTHGEHT